MQLDNVNIGSATLLPTPQEIKAELPLTHTSIETVAAGRQLVRDILDKKDDRLLVIVGPCSIHDLASAKDYATRLRKLASHVDRTMALVMRVYFEKPRTVVGWKGFINDPRLDDSFHIEEGLRKAREFLLYCADLGLPTATEALDPIMPQYLSDLVTWTAIGARTAESQTHREMASGLSSPVGFKNGIDGNLAVALNAMQSSSRPHHFLGIDQHGRCAVFQTRGNPYSHIVLRGGTEPNFDPESIQKSESLLQSASLRNALVIDCSHGNSCKDYTRQPHVFRECLTQRIQGTHSIIGLMLESNINEGRQDIPANLSHLRYGVSVTDSCIGWETTAELIGEANIRLRSQQ